MQCFTRNWFCQNEVLGENEQLQALAPCYRLQLYLFLILWRVILRNDAKNQEEILSFDETRTEVFLPASVSARALYLQLILDELLI